MFRLQLKPVRSLENFKNTSPISSPDHWVHHSKTSVPMPSPPNRFFLQNLGHSQETQNLLQSPDDMFLSPPSVPPRVPPRELSRDLYSFQPFIVGGGHSENGDPLFYVANQHSVDIVKLSPPTCSPRRKVIILLMGGNIEWTIFIWIIDDEIFFGKTKIFHLEG